MMSATPGLRGTFSFSKSRIDMALSFLFISSSFLQSIGRGGGRENKRKVSQDHDFFASDGRIMARSRKTDKMG